MAGQAQRVGAELKRLREARNWKGREVVEAMDALGDRTLNTNQLSRYENGGAMPGEQRLANFATVFETTPAALLTGKSEPGATNGDLMDSLKGGERTLGPQPVEVQIAALRAELLAELAEVRKGQEDLRSLLESGKRSRAKKRN